MMIQANELRIGNNIISTQTGTIIKVNYHNIRYAQINIDNSYEPILLTPEILERCGFVWDTVTHHINDFMLAENEGYFDLFLKSMGFGIFAKVYHLHQLQNLYYALNGTELTIKEL